MTKKHGLIAIIHHKRMTINSSNTKIIIPPANHQKTVQKAHQKTINPRFVCPEIPVQMSPPGLKIPNKQTNPDELLVGALIFFNEKVTYQSSFTSEKPPSWAKSKTSKKSGASQSSKRSQPGSCVVGTRGRCWFLCQVIFLAKGWWKK